MRSAILVMHFQDFRKFSLRLFQITGNPNISK
jgi:hypothetical protein